MILVSISYQWWKVIKYTYSSTVLKYNFGVFYTATLLHYRGIHCTFYSTTITLPLFNTQVKFTQIKLVITFLIKILLTKYMDFSDQLIKI